ncbi:MAG: type II toxin-antitoxin system VapC family toxin [Candidatus Latescibacteria bacterium]|nr:type II toxin-antitoxin system VapC family toxin [Candidatus Latescibacterota bacterium]
MKKNLLFDTDVLIDFLKGRDEAITFLESQALQWFISTVTVAELYAGVREGNEKIILENFIETFTILPISINIAQKGGLFRRDYGKSKGIGLADALIAATAEEYDLTLVTLNRKHFSMITNLHVPYNKQ